MSSQNVRPNPIVIAGVPIASTLKAGNGFRTG